MLSSAHVARISHYKPEHSATDQLLTLNTCRIAKPNRFPLWLLCSLCPLW